MLLFATTFAAYFPVWHGQPIWDDDAHMTRRDLQSFDGLVRIWFEPHATQQYYPVTHSAFWLEQKIFGDATPGYHLLNIFLHVLNALLLLKILRRLQVPGAWLAAAIFALHPVHVESVAWITELKNTLSGVCYLGAALLYLKFDEGRQKKFYAMALLLFAVGLFAKSVIASLPAALLIIFWWKRDRLSWKKDVWPLLPFFVVGLAAGLFTAWVEREMIGAHGSEFDLSFLQRCGIAGRGFWFYLGKLFWPAPLIFIYPRWNINQGVWWPYPVAALLLVAALWFVRRRCRGSLAAVLFFGGTLFPALGFMNVYPFRYSFVADHFQYLASLGIIVLISAGVAISLRNRARAQQLAIRSSCLALLALFTVLIWRQSAIYTDMETLWADTLKKDPTSFLAQNNIGTLLDHRGDLAGAESHFLAALSIYPRYDEALGNLGLVRAKQGRLAEGIDYTRQALAISPEKAAIRIGLADLLCEANEFEQAKLELLKVVEARPEYVRAHLSLAAVFMKLGNQAESIRHEKEAIRLSAGSAPFEACENLAYHLFQQRDFKEAANYYAAAAKLKPGDAKTQLSLGVCMVELKNYQSAIPYFHEALRLDPNNAAAMYELAWILATAPRPEVRDGAEAVRLARRTASAPLRTSGLGAVARIQASSYIAAALFGSRRNAS